jgi:uncharacterized YccA/Bax inhibitor family protein
MLRSSNPVMHNFKRSERSLEDFQNPPNTDMTIRGTLNKTAYLLALAVVAHWWAWDYCTKNPQSILAFIWGGLLVGAGISFIISLKPKLAPTLSTIYALIKGAFLGAISIYFEAQYPGVISQAILVTLAVILAMVFLYHFGLVKVEGNFKKAVIIATVGIMLFYITSLIAAYLFDFHFAINSIKNPTLLGMAFSLFAVALASFNLVIDFQFIEHGSNTGLPKFMEWYGAFGLMVTIVWLYIEVLKLLAKMRNR